MVINVIVIYVLIMVCVHINSLKFAIKLFTLYVKFIENQFIMFRSSIKHHKVGNCKRTYYLEGVNDSC